MGGGGEGGTDALSLGLLSALTKHGYALDTDALASRWILGPLPDAPIKTIRNELPDYLAAVEAEGWSEFFWMFADYSPAVRELVEWFRLWLGKDVGTAEQPRLVFLPPTPVGTWGHRLELVNVAVEKWANRRAVRTKHNAPDASEGRCMNPSLRTTDNAAGVCRSRGESYRTFADEESRLRSDR